MNLGVKMNSLCDSLTAPIFSSFRNRFASLYFPLLLILISLSEQSCRSFWLCESTCPFISCPLPFRWLLMPADTIAYIGLGIYAVEILLLTFGLLSLILLCYLINKTKGFHRNFRYSLIAQFALLLMSDLNVFSGRSLAFRNFKFDIGRSTVRNVVTSSCAVEWFRLVRYLETVLNRS